MVQQGVIAEIARGYLVCQLWAQRDPDREDELLDAHYGLDNLAPRVWGELEAELGVLLGPHEAQVELYGQRREHNPADGTVWEHFGHDFYLTREGHGSGFWDRGLGDLGDYLTTVARQAGEAVELFDPGDGTLVHERELKLR